MAYPQVGIIEFLAGLFVYYIVMAEYGFFPHLLFGLRVNWEDGSINDLEDSYGQEWVSKGYRVTVKVRVSNSVGIKWRNRVGVSIRVRAKDRVWVRVRVRVRFRISNSVRVRVRD
jgi:hypothetical protein